jgi:DNA-binding response OmpR family regulator
MGRTLGGGRADPAEGAPPLMATVDRAVRRDYHRAPMSPPDDRQRVLIVEDEPNIASFARMYLEAAGFSVSVAERGDEGLRQAEAEPPHLVILDLMLPGMDGYEVTKRLRQGGAGATPVIMLTARDDAVDKVVGLELGADDYITKPFNPRELVARVRAVLRRAGGRPTGLESCRIGDIDIDFRTHQAHRAGQRIDFTAREFDLLRYLVAHTGQVVTREQILNQVWGYEESPTTRTIDNFVAKLRQKIEPAPHEPEHILTVHGAGYKFVG